MYAIDLIDAPSEISLVVKSKSLTSFQLVFTNYKDRDSVARSIIRLIGGTVVKFN